MRIHTRKVCGYPFPARAFPLKSSLASLNGRNQLGSALPADNQRSASRRSCACLCIEGRATATPPLGDARQLLLHSSSTPVPLQFHFDEADGSAPSILRGESPREESSLQRRSPSLELKVGHGRCVARPRRLVRFLCGTPAAEDIRPDGPLRTDSGRTIQRTAGVGAMG